MKQTPSVFRFSTVLLLVCAWLFSGWPHIGNFPPSIQEAQAASVISFVTSCTGSSSCTAANTTGDLEIAYAGRDGSSGSTAPSLPTGWTSVTTNTLNGTSSADGSIRMACKVTTGNSEASGTFTNASKLVIHVYRGQRAGTTATCASTILGTPSNYNSTVNTTTTTETFNAITSGDPSSWIAGFGYCGACTAGIATAPATMTNHSSVTGPPAAGGHDSNTTDAAFSAANVTLTTAGRVFTTTVEIKAYVATTPSFDVGTGTYNNDQSITITKDAGDTVCYTTDGSTPAATTPGTCSTGSAYSSPVSITATATTLKAIATKAGTSNSAVQSATYTLTVGAITSAPGAGSYNGTQSVTLSIATTTGGTAHYTTDGSAVSCASPTYSGAFNVTTTTTVKAIGCKTNYNSDSAISDLYTITQAPAAPTNVAATDGSATNKVTITWTKSSGATDYHVWRDSTDLGSAGDVATFDDTGADASTITAGSAVASDGTSAAQVDLSVSGASAVHGTTHTYKVVASNTAGNSPDSATDTGYRGVGSLTYQWQRSAADSDASYSDISGATSAGYADTAAPSDGSGRYFRVVENAIGASQQTSAVDRGYKIAAVISVTITSNGTISFGTLTTGSSKSTVQLGTTPIAKNDGNVAEDFNIIGADTACPWTLSAGAGSERYTYEFSSNGGGAWTTISSQSYQGLASNIAVNGTQGTDLRITTPTATNCYSAQSANVTIQAVAH